MFGPLFGDLFTFEYEVTEHLCPECGHPLTLVVDSTMLKCINKHGPFFLVKE